MKKKILKLILLSVSTIALLSSPVLAAASSTQIELIPLKKYNTDTVITINNMPVSIPKYSKVQETQFRGIWISSVFNLDFPSKKGMTQESFKAEYSALLDNLQAKNFNAVIFQVRPKSDAFYPSKLNPWSEFLTGTQGKSPGWDPMLWMIEETHNRGMEFHAWFNPYRVTTAAEPKKTKAQQLAALASTNWARLNPQYIFSYQGKLYLNPGEPAVMNYINESVMEVVKNYDIDAVHFDDYFYPAKNAKDPWYGPEEKKAYDQYGKGYKDTAAWRRNNVDTLVKNIHDAIDLHNTQKSKSVQFGISPNGIWGHYGKHPEGSPEGVGSLTPVTSQSSYDTMFADTRKWVKNNWIDYIAPQLYWTFDEKAAPYGELANWWAETVKGTKTQLYIGHASYKQLDAGIKNTSWRNLDEISNQLKFNSMYDEIKGSAFFSYKSLFCADERTSQYTDLLCSEHFGAMALLPSKPWLDHKETLPPAGLSLQKAAEGIKLAWTDKTENDSAYYVIYRMDGDGDQNSIKSVRNILAKLRRPVNEETISFIDTTALTDRNYIYAVTAVDRAQIETADTVLSYLGTRIQNNAVKK